MHWCKPQTQNTTNMMEDEEFSMYARFSRIFPFKLRSKRKYSKLLYLALLAKVKHTLTF